MNLNDPDFDEPREVEGFRARRARVGRQLGSEKLGVSFWELPPGQAAYPYHWHLTEEELLVVLEGTPSLRTPDGWRELADGEVVAFPRGERGAHGYRNDSADRVRVLVISEMNAPNLTVYPDTNQVGIFDAGQRAERRFGALFNVADAVADYGGKASIVPPAPGPRHDEQRT